MNARRLIELVEKLKRPGQPVYLVGGAVRDHFLAREPHDLDFSAEGDVRSLATAVADHLEAGFYALDEERGTYRVVLEGGRTAIDFASLRGTDLRGDLVARDFRINAMAIDLNHPQDLIDPLGGSEDLRQKRLRACSPTSLADDPARTLRAVRLSIALGLEIDGETLDWVREAGPLLTRISPERIRDEVFRMLESKRSSECLRLLDSLHLLSQVFPELEALKGVAQSAPHVNPVWEHTLEVLDRLDTLWEVLVEPDDSAAVSDPLIDAVLGALGRFHAQIAAHFAARILVNRSLRALIAFAALYHDIAKPHTRSVELDGRIRFLGHDDLGAQKAAARAKALAFSGDETARVQSIISGHMRVHQMAQGEQPPTARAVYRFFRATGQAGIDICLLSLADTWGTFGQTLTLEHWQAELDVCQILMEARWERMSQLVSPPRLVDGNDLMRLLKLAPGPAIGRLLEAVREAQVEGEVATREQALEYVRRLAQDLV